MYNKVDIIITLSQYLIRPQQRRIFALLCKDRVSDYVAFTEYCNHMRRFRDIHGKLVIIRYRILKYYDIRGFWINNNNIPKIYSRYDNIYEIDRRLIQILIINQNKNNDINICTYSDISKIRFYGTNNITYEWNNNRELVQTKVQYDNYDNYNIYIYIYYERGNIIRITLFTYNKVYNLL